MVFPVSMKGVCLRVGNSSLQIKGRPLCLEGCDMAREPKWEVGHTPLQGAPNVRSFGRSLAREKMKRHINLDFFDQSLHGSKFAA